MSVRMFAAAAAVLALSAAAVSAHEAKVGALVLKDLHMRATLGANPNTGAYVTVANTGATADRLIAASCACAAKVELHEMSDAGGVMKMRKVDGFDVPAGGQLVLAPRGKHLMVMGLKAPAKDGEDVQMTLTFAKAGKLTTNFHVKTDPSAADPHAGHAGHAGH